MAFQFTHRAPVLALLGGLSGLLGTIFLGGNYGNAPQLGAYMVLAGLWFGLAIGFAIWRWSSTPIAAAAMTVLITWIGWEAAINVALQIDRPWPEAIEIASVHKYYITGFMAGAVGAAITWAGVAIHFPALRCARAAATVTATGAVLGLLLPVTNIVDSGWILLLPWQAGVAAIIGLHLPSPQYGDALA